MRHEHPSACPCLHPVGLLFVLMVGRIEEAVEKHGEARARALELALDDGQVRVVVALVQIVTVVYLYALAERRGEGVARRLITRLDLADRILRVRRGQR